MLKLQHKLKYAIDLGVDFLLRNIDESGIIANIKNLEQHCLGVLCLVENSKNSKEKIDFVLKQIAKFIYSKDDELFILDEEEQLTSSINAIVSLIFSNFGNTDWGVKFGNTLLKKQKKDGYIEEKNIKAQIQMGLSIKAFLKLFELTQDKMWFEKAKAAGNWLVENLKDIDYWDMVGIQQLNFYSKNQKSKKIIDTMIEKHYDDLHICANYKIEKLHSNWIEHLENLSYKKMEEQKDPSDPWKGGAFLDENMKPRLDWSYKNIDSFKKILKVVEEYKRN